LKIVVRVMLQCYTRWNESSWLSRCVGG